VFSSSPTVTESCRCLCAVFRAPLHHPSGKVVTSKGDSVTLGQNIRALRVDGVFFVAEDMVKSISKMTMQHHNLTSTIRCIARWLPQMFYFSLLTKALKSKTNY
jgi:hypothetical protein